ncbi:MAG: hypothetical protein MHMPM18_002745 [Marteilia pararefringens]
MVPMTTETLDFGDRMAKDDLQKLVSQLQVHQCCYDFFMVIIRKKSKKTRSHMNSTRSSNFDDDNNENVESRQCRFGYPMPSAEKRAHFVKYDFGSESS